MHTHLYYVRVCTLTLKFYSGSQQTSITPELEISIRLCKTTVWLFLELQDTNYGKNEFIYTVISSVISFLTYFCFGSYSNNVRRISYTTYMREQEYIQNCGWKPARHRHIEIRRPNFKDIIKTQHTKADCADVARTVLSRDTNYSLCTMAFNL